MGILTEETPKENSLFPPMPELLERAGFVLRGRNRATCPHCSGRDHSTVGFNDEVAHCHRCHWKANQVTLAREMGVIRDDPAIRDQLRQEQRERWKREAPKREFEAWRERQIRELTGRYRNLGRKAELARKVLAIDPGVGLAWNALADFHHNEAKLLRALDVLTYAKASRWLEHDMTEDELFNEWKAARHA